MGNDEYDWNKWYVENQIPYVEAPEDYWRTMSGETISMHEMSLDHIKNCIKKIDKDIESSKRTVLSKDNERKMKKKKQELKSIFRRKSQF